jgi:hypothetical protein
MRGARLRVGGVGESRNSDQDGLDSRNRVRNVLASPVNRNQALSGVILKPDAALLAYWSKFLRK